MNNRLRGNLYLVTDRHQTRGRPLLDVIKTAIDAGVRAVQLRERNLPIRELLVLAKKMKDLSVQSGASLLINDRIDVCLAVDAAGVHLRSDRLSVSTARKLLGPKKLIGVSCHTIDEVITAEKEGANFVVLGPVYPTPSKRPYGLPIGLEAIREASSNTEIPIYAIGGIRPDHVPELFDGGVSGVAVISSVLNAEDVKGAVYDMISSIQTVRSSPIAIDRMEAR